MLMRHHLSREDQTYLSDLKNVGVDEAVPLKKSNDIEELTDIHEVNMHQSSLESFKPAEDDGHMIHVYKPLKYAAEPAKRPLSPILFLFQHNGNSISLLKRMKPIAEELGWLIVGVDAYRNTKSLQDQYRSRMKGTKAAYEWAMDNLVFDSEKIVFGGFSGGGWWAYQCTAEIDKTAAAVISLGGWMGNMHDKSYAKKMAVAQVNGSDDSGALAYENKDAHFMSARRRAQVKAFHFNGGHVVAPEEVLLEAARWIHSEKDF
jgi:predicted esterase